MTKSYSASVPTTGRRRFVIRADRLRVFVMRGTTKWWSPYDKGMPYDIEGGGNTYYTKEDKEMLALREEELNMINGGNAAKGMLGGAKFNVGDKVISKSAPDGGVGTVEKSKYDKGWWYSVRMQGGLLYTPESDLEPALMVQSL